MLAGTVRSIRGNFLRINFYPSSTNARRSLMNAPCFTGRMHDLTQVSVSAVAVGDPR